MSIKTSNQLYNIQIKFIIKEKFEIVIESRPTDLISRTIRKFQESLKKSLNGQFDK